MNDELNKKKEELKNKQQQIKSNQQEYNEYCKEEEVLQKQLDTIQEENNKISSILQNQTIINLIEKIRQQNKQLKEEDQNKAYPFINFHTVAFTLSLI